MLVKHSFLPHVEQEWMRDEPKERLRRRLLSKEHSEESTEQHIPQAKSNAPFV